MFQPVNDPLDAPAELDGDEEDKHLRLLYLAHLRHATGRNVAVHASVRRGERCAHELRTERLPTYDVPATEPSSVVHSPELAGVELSMDTLAELAATDAVAELAAGLRPLSAGYADWLAKRSADTDPLPEALRGTAAAAVTTARAIADRIGAGIDLLAADSLAREAFAFANRAMALQRRATQIGQSRERSGLSYAPAQAGCCAGTGQRMPPGARSSSPSYYSTCRR